MPSFEDKGKTRGMNMTNNSKGGGHTGSGNRPIYSRAMQYATMRSGRVRIPGKKPAPRDPPSFRPLPPAMREKLFTPVTKYRVVLEESGKDTIIVHRGSSREAEKTLTWWLRFKNLMTGKTGKIEKTD